MAPPLTQGIPAPTQTLPSWLRNQRLAHHWSIAEMGRQLRQAAKTTGDHTIPTAAILASYARRWETGRMGITERYRLHYCTALGLQPDDFGPAQPAPPAGTTTPPEQDSPIHQVNTALDTPPSQFGPAQPTPPAGTTTSAGTTTTPLSQDSPAHSILIIATIPPGCHHITINLPSHTHPTRRNHAPTAGRQHPPGPRRVTW
jgi:hypothetical protein